MATQHHDTGYKELFSYPEFVQQLIGGFAPPEIAGLMDFSTLKNHSGHYITPLFEEKVEDVVWSVEITWKGVTQRVFLYILMEFQSRVDRSMPIRLMHYVAGFYSGLLKQKIRIKDTHLLDGTSRPAMLTDKPPAEGLRHDPAPLHADLA